MNNQVTIQDKTFEKLIEYEAIEKRLRLLGIQLNVDLEKMNPVFIGILNGSFLFMADLIKQINIPCEIAFMKVSSYYGGMESTRTMKDEYDLTMDITGRNIVIVEDIVDTGNTINYLVTKLKSRNPASIKVCTLLYKPETMEHDIDELLYVAFEIKNEFVVGYGLDYRGYGRNLCDIYKLAR